MPRAVNQSMAWVIATVLSILLFTGGLALFGTIKPKDKGFAEQPAGAHEHGEASEGSHGDPEAAAEGHQHDSKEEPAGHEESAHAEAPAAHGHEEKESKSADAPAGEEEISAEHYNKNGNDAEKEAHGGHGEH